MNVINRAVAYAVKEGKENLLTSLLNINSEKGLVKILKEFYSTYKRLPNANNFKTYILHKHPNYSSTFNKLIETEFDDITVSIIKSSVAKEVVMKDINKLLENINEEETESVLVKLDKIKSSAVNILDSGLVNPKDDEYAVEAMTTVESFIPILKQKNYQFAGLNIIGGDTGGGKSIYLLQQLMYNYERGKDVAMFSLELSRFEVYARMYSLVNNVPFEKVYANPNYIDRVNEWKKDYFNRDNQFLIMDNDLTTDGLYSELETLKGYVIGIDYLNLVEPAEKDSFKENFFVLSKMAKHLHKLAKRLGQVIFSPVQINKEDVKEKDNVIKISVRGSKELLFSATSFVYLLKSEESNGEDEFDIMKAYFLKTRNAPKCVVILEADFACMKFLPTVIYERI